MFSIKINNQVLLEVKLKPKKLPSWEERKKRDSKRREKPKKRPSERSKRDKQSYWRSTLNRYSNNSNSSKCLLCSNNNKCSQLLLDNKCLDHLKEEILCMNILRKTFTFSRINNSNNNQYTNNRTWVINNKPSLLFTNKCNNNSQSTSNSNRCQLYSSKTNNKCTILINPGLPRTSMLFLTLATMEWELTISYQESPAFYEHDAMSIYF